MTEEEKSAQARPSAGPSAGGTNEEAARTGVGLDLAAVEASVSATVRAGQWLLGTAGALVPVIVAGVQITRLGDVVVGSLAFWLSMAALGTAVIAIAAVLISATRVLRIPYADLSDVSRLRRAYRTNGWTKNFAREQWDRTELSISAATGGSVTDIPSLHDRLQTLRASDASSDISEAKTLSEVARVAVAIANRAEVERRFGHLLMIYITAVVVVLAAVTTFVGATAISSDNPPIDEPLAVRLFPKDGSWQEPLENCAEKELLGTAVGGRWPSPIVTVAARGKCQATLIEDPAEITVVPIVHDTLVAAPSSAPSGPAINRPVPVVIYRVGPSWPRSLRDLRKCHALSLSGSAVAGNWPTPTVVARGKINLGCPPTKIEVDLKGVVVVPSTAAQT